MTSPELTELKAALDLYASQYSATDKLWAYFVANLANIRDIGCGSLRVLSENRDSASRVSLC